MRSFASFAAVLWAGMSTTVAVAQDPPVDWDLFESTERKMVAASTTFSSGITIALRCMDGQYDALIGGLPPVDPGTEERPLSLQFGDAPSDERSWYVGTNASVAISPLPARLARQLREGGQVRLRVQEGGEGARRIRHDLDLPASAATIDRTLAACDRPSSDARDELIQETDTAGLTPDIFWASPPRPRYPTGRTFTRGFVTVSCLSQPDGRLAECVAESEYPLRGGFAEAALSATSRARLENRANPGAPLPVRLVVYTTRFTMEGEAEVYGRSRLGRRD